MTQNQDNLVGLAKMRDPFPPNQISKLPQPMKRREEMDKLPKAKCGICGGYHATSMVMHLDYVGHAALTNRLLDADPLWVWEPVAVNADGSPHMDAQGGMWIKLTVCGVTRLGYGDAQGKLGPNAVKECIGDALRNAAMRFGAALDLWHKGDDLNPQQDDDPPPKAAEPAKAKPAGAHITDAQVSILRDLLAALEASEKEFCEAVKIPALEEMPAERYTFCHSYLSKKLPGKA